jgi:hypothetical protein
VKLGVKPGHRISVLGVDEPVFAGELEDAGANVSLRLRRDSDIIIYAADSFRDLDRLTDLRRYIVSNGAIWVVRRKGKDAPIRDIDVIEAGLAAKMVDNKIAAFSDDLAAMRLVVRIVDRRKT